MVEELGFMGLYKVSRGREGEGGGVVEELGFMGLYKVSRGREGKGGGRG